MPSAPPDPGRSGRRRPSAPARSPALERVGVVLAVAGEVALRCAAAMGRAARVAVAAARRGRRRLAPFAHDVAAHALGAWARARRWGAELARAAEPLQGDALAGWEHVVHHDLPALGRRLGPVAAASGRAARRSGAVVLAAALSALSAARRAGRRARPARAERARPAAPVAVRVGVPLALLGVAGWFLPGPMVRAAARMVDPPADPFPPLEQRSVVTAADGSVLGVVHDGENRRVVDLGEVPPVVRRLVTVAEDRRFYDHDGFDQSAIVRAAIANLRSQEVAQGGSTITQQLVKQNLVGRDRSPLRKARELVLATAVERETTKAELLHRYVNEVYFGAGAYGLAAAAETYFGTEPARLAPEQAALLVALIRAPSSLDPWEDGDALLARRNQVLRGAADEGVLSRADARALAARPLGVLARPNTPGVVDRDLVGAVEREIAARPELGGSPAERLRRFRSGGWSVQTTIDPALQRLARRVAEGRLATAAPGAAIAAVEPGTGRVRALFSRRPAELADVEVASSGRRQPGSAFKPLAAIAALEAGLDPDERLTGRNEVTFDAGPETWEVHNFGDRDHPSPELGEALRDSVNTAFAQLGVAVGADRLSGVAGRLGVDLDAALGPPSERGPALALGGARHGVTPLEMAAAYAAIANDGVYAAPTLIERIVDAHGREVLRIQPKPRAAVDPAVNGHVRTILQAVVSEGTGTAAALPGWVPFGKTGTSQDGADAWFVGAVPTLAAAVWAGDPRGRAPMPTATGGTVAAPAWRALMAGALEGQPPSFFAEPPPLPPPPGLALPEPGPALPDDEDDEDGGKG